MGVAFGVLVTIITLGFLWFYIARPILEDFGVIGPRVVSYTEVENAPIVMSRESEPPLPRTPDMDAVYIPVEQTSMDDGMEWQMPRISAYLDDTEFVVLLARQKLRNGKYRLTANKIVETVGGDRNKLLEIVRQVRQAPEFAAAAPEQEQKRTELGLAAR